MAVTTQPSAPSNGNHTILRPGAPTTIPSQPELPVAPAVAPQSVPAQPPVQHPAVKSPPVVVDLFEQEPRNQPPPSVVEAPAPVAHVTAAPVAQAITAPVAPGASELFAGDHVPIAVARVEQPAPAEPLPAPVMAVVEPPPVAPEPRAAEPVEYERKHVAHEPQPTVIKTSIFSVIEDDDEEEVEETGTHWAQKYIQPKQEVHAPPVVEPRRDVIRPQLETVHAAAAPTVRAPVEVRQPSLKLAQDDVARFKGTDKTIVDGDDLDVPTWMRMRGVAKG